MHRYVLWTRCIDVGPDQFVLDLVFLVRHVGTVVEWSDKQADKIWQMPLSTLTPEIRLQRSGSHPHALQAWGSSLYYLTASGR